MLRVPWGMGFLSRRVVLGALAPQTTPSAKNEVLVLNGRSYFRYTWPAFYGVPAGPAKESACGVTAQWLPA